MFTYQQENKMMNERIKEMWEEATVSVWPRPGKFTAGEYDYHLEKFAELIVQECLKIVEPDQTSGDEWCVTLDETAQSIRQHFGLELKNE
jgi:hypothetical protein